LRKATWDAPPRQSHTTKNAMPICPSLGHYVLSEHGLTKKASAESQ
jgi:hypothetical protein